MKVLFFLFLLSFENIQGGTEAECDAEADRAIVKCKFPENVNSSRTDYSVYFSSEAGSQEVLVDCAWLGNGLHCIKQTGVECEQFVSNSAVIYVPTSYAERNGSYKCLTHGFVVDDTKPCRFSAKQDKKHLAECEANASWEIQKVTLKCTFSFNVEKFCIQNGTTVVANYTKSDCLKSNQCNLKRDNGHDVFTVNLPASQSPGGEFFCRALDSHSTSLEVRKCSVSMDTSDESKKGSSITVHAGIAVAAGLLALLSTTIIVVLIRRRSRRNREKSMRKNCELSSAQAHLIRAPVQGQLSV